MTPLPSLIQAQIFALLEQLPVASYVFRLEDPADPGSLRIVFANSASFEALGLAPATVVGTLIGEHFPNSDSTGIAAAYRDVVVNQEARDFGAITYSDEAIGTSRFALSAHPLGPDMVVIFFENLTATPERRQELATIVDSATDAIISKDLDGTILSWNQSAERIYGYSAEEAIGRPISMLLPPDRPHEVDEIIARLRAGERVEQFETQRVCKDGTVLEMSLTISPLNDLAGKIVGAATIARDITAEKAAARGLQRLAAIVAASEDAITSRTLDGTLLSWNAAAERLFGYSADEMIGRSVNVLDPDEVPDDVREIRARMERGERRARPYEAPARRKDGTEVLVSVSSWPITDESGQAVGIASVMRDMTEQRRLLDQLRQSQKMEAIGSLAGGVAHDFNNVLTVIRTASEAVLADLEDGSAREKVRQIDLAAEHAASLTSQLLAFSRQQVLLPEEIDLNAIVRETSEMAARLVGEHVRVELELGDNLRVRMDRGQLQQVILNLFVNARDAMPEGGELKVRTSRITLDDTYASEHFEVVPGEYVLLEVVDSGRGMDAETIGRIFDPFFTTKEEGTGLGLATVYGIVKQSGGEIFVYSEPGLGTSFKVYLPPAGAGEPAATPAVPPRESQGVRGTETILLVEDADLLRPLIIEILKSSGYTVLAAADGFEAVELFDESGGVIDLLLTDIVMPRMSGRELAEHVLARSPGTRIIFTSGYPDDSSISRLIEQPNVHFIQKPYGGSDLLAMIRAALAL